MPVHKVKGGYKFGSKGKVFPTRKQAVAQGAAIKISQAKRKKQYNKENRRPTINTQYQVMAVFWAFEHPLKTP